MVLTTALPDGIHFFFRTWWSRTRDRWLLFAHLARRLPYLLYRTIVARVDGEVVGFVSMPMRAGVGEIGLIAVAAEARGSGVGVTLLSAALPWMERSGMHTCVAKVRVDNPGG